MNHALPPPSDDDIDRLLGSTFRRTSPRFELRWRELRAQWSHPAPAPPRAPRRLLWIALTAAGIAAAVSVVVLRNPLAGPAAGDLDGFAEVLSLDAALAPGVALLERETREAVLHLSVEPEL